MQLSGKISPKSDVSKEPRDEAKAGSLPCEDLGQVLKYLSSHKSIFFSKMQFLSKALIRLSSQKIGIDEFGNEYFKNKNGKRFVVYKGIPEASKVPMEWHGWLHYTTDTPPVQINTHKFSWQKIHLPNLTGNKNSHSPKNSLISKSNASYQAWKP